MDILHFLESIGLSKKEAKVYISLLPHDELSIQEVSKNSKINRTTVYPIIRDLIEKGFVGQKRIDKKVAYFAEPPERIGVYIANKKSELTAQENELKDIIPQLKSRSVAKGAKPIVKIYEGREGILNSVHDFFEAEQEGGTARLLYPRNKLEDLFTPTEMKEARKERLSHNIHAKSIYTAEKEGLHSDKNGDRIWLDEKQYPNISCDFSIYGDKVRIHTLGKNLSSVFIQNQDIADTLTTLFDIAYESLNKKGPKKK